MSDGGWGGGRGGVEGGYSGEAGHCGPATAPRLITCAPQLAVTKSSSASECQSLRRDQGHDGRVSPVYDASDSHAPKRGLHGR